jgi:hypothetical protein
MVRRVDSVKIQFEVKTYTCYGCGLVAEDPNCFYIIGFEKNELILCNGCGEKMEWMLAP